MSPSMNVLADPTSWRDESPALFAWQLPAWMARARCRGHGTDGWFAGAGTPAEQRALVICAGCPVAEPCLAFAVANDLVGVWGGTTRQDRKVAARERRRRG